MAQKAEFYGPRTFPKQPRLMLSGFFFQERVQAARPLDVEFRILKGNDRERFALDDEGPVEPVIERGARGTVIRECDHPIWGRCVVTHFDAAGARPALFVYMPPDALASVEQDREETITTNGNA